MQIRITNDVNPAFCSPTKSRLSGHTSLQTQFQGKTKNCNLLLTVPQDAKCCSGCACLWRLFKAPFTLPFQCYELFLDSWWRSLSDWLHGCDCSCICCLWPGWSGWLNSRDLVGQLGVDAAVARWTFRQSVIGCKEIFSYIEWFSLLLFSRDLRALLIPLVIYCFFCIKTLNFSKVGHLFIDVLIRSDADLIWARREDFQICWVQCISSIPAGAWTRYEHFLSTNAFLVNFMICQLLHDGILLRRQAMIFFRSVIDRRISWFGFRGSCFNP